MITIQQALQAFQVSPRRWQEEALNEWRRSQRGTVAVATGGGKTFFAYFCMREFAADQPDGKILVVVPTIALLDQWLVGLVHDVGIPRSAIKVLASSSQPNETKPFNLCVINSAREAVGRVTGGGEAWFFCVDECHRAGSPENARALQGGFAATLGLSATPERQYDQGFENYVAPVIGDVIYQYGIEEALADEVISPFAIFNYRIPLEDDEKAQYDALTRRLALALREQKRGRDVSEKVERILIQRAGIAVTARWRIPAAVALARDHVAPTLLFHERIDAADEIARLLNRVGRRTVAYHSRLSAGVRQRNLEMFRAGVADVLVACRSLDEGFNVPEAEVGLLAASTRSTRQRIQRLGRVLRRTDAKMAAKVLTLYATDAEEKQLQEEARGLAGVAEVRWLKADIRDD